MNFVAPTSLDEAYRALAVPGAMCLAGGQSLVAAMNLGVASPGQLVSLRNLQALKGIEVQVDGGLRVGAMTTHAELAALQSRSARPRLARPHRRTDRLSGGAQPRHDRRLRCTRRSGRRLSGGTGRDGCDDRDRRPRRRTNGEGARVLSRALRDRARAAGARAGDPRTRRTAAGRWLLREALAGGGRLRDRLGRGHRCRASRASAKRATNWSSAR